MHRSKQPFIWSQTSRHPRSYAALAAICCRSAAWERDYATAGIHRGGLGGVAAWPVALRAQQAERVRRIGVLMLFAEGGPEGQRHGGRADRLAIST
jgi:hypothetical protein